MQDGRDVWWHDARRRRSRPTARPSRWTPRTCSSSSTRAARPGSPRASCTRPAGTSPRSRSRTSTCSTSTPTTDVYWCTADCGWVTGHSYIVYGPLANRATSVHVRRHARLPRQGPVLVDRREVQGDDPLHRADRDPDVHEVGHRVPRAPRPVVAAAARLGRRADQPRGVGLVLEAHRRRALPGRRHVVADRDRRHHDQPAARRDHAQAGQRDVPAARASAPTSSTTRASRSPIPGGGYLVLTRPWPSMLRGIWGDPERYRETYWSPLRRPLLRRRRRQARRRRLLLAARPGRRHHARRRPQHLDHRGRVARSCRTRRSPRPRSSAGPTRRRVRRSARS